MLSATEIAGFAGAGLAGGLRAADFPPDPGPLLGGDSRLAFAVWLLASVLITAHAVAIGAGVFIVLGGIQIVATALIMLYAIRYKDTSCPSHLPSPPRAKAATRPGSPGDELGSWRPAGRLVAEPAMPAGHGGALRAHVPVRHPQSGAVTGCETTYLKETT